MIAVLALLTGSAPAQSFADLVKTHAITAVDERRIGERVLGMSRWLHGEVGDPELVARVERITRRVVAASDQPDKVVTVVVARDPSVNASAYPGGILVVNRGAAELFDDDELTFVIAHEVSHVLLRHFANTQNLREATGQISAMSSSMAASDREAAFRQSLELRDMMSRYGRQLEYEADLYGLLYAMRAGVPGEAAVRAMEKLKEAVGPMPVHVREVANHPTFDDRVAQLRTGHEGVLSTQRKFEVGRLALASGMHETAIDAYREYLSTFPRSAAGWGNLAVAHLELGLEQSPDPWVDQVPVRPSDGRRVRGAEAVHFERARDACGRSLAIHPHDPQCLLLLGVLARRAGAVDEARELFARADALSEGPSAAVAVNLGILEAVAGNQKAAEKHWKRARQADPDTPYVPANRAVWMEQQGDLEGARAAWGALAESGDLPGRTRAALRRLEAALPAPEPRGEVRLGDLRIGEDIGRVGASLGEPTFEEGDDIGLNVYRSWSERGIAALFSADVAVGLSCWDPCGLPVRKVRVGQDFEPALEALGRPSEVVRDPSFGPGRIAHYAGLGLTVFESRGRVSRLELWDPGE